MLKNQNLSTHSTKPIFAQSQSQPIENYLNERERLFDEVINELEKESENILSFSNPNIFFPSIGLIFVLIALISLCFGVNVPILCVCSAAFMVCNAIPAGLIIHDLLKNTNDTPDKLEDTSLVVSSSLTLDHTTDSMLDSLQQQKTVTESSQQNHGHTGTLFFRSASKVDPNKEEPKEPIYAMPRQSKNSN